VSKYIPGGRLLINFFESIFSQQSKSHFHKSSSSFSWTATASIFLFLCLIVILPSVLYIALHLSSTRIPVRSQPHLSYPTVDPESISFSTYDRSDFQFDHMEMDDNWYFE
jgi:hypothetical protein